MIEGRILGIRGWREWGGEWTENGKKRIKEGGGDRGAGNGKKWVKNAANWNDEAGEVHEIVGEQTTHSNHFDLFRLSYYRRSFAGLFTS